MIHTSIQNDISQDFRFAMRRLAASVSVVTANYQGVRAGMTATAVSSLCLNPPSILVCVNIEASIHPLIISSRQFCVNILHQEQKDIASVFGSKLPQPERFSRDAWASDPHGLPYLEDAQSNIFCEHGGELTYGTHSIFVGRVRKIRSSQSVSPLIYADGKFAGLASLN